MSAKLVIIVPTLGRSPRLKPLVENIAETTPPIYRVLFVLDPDDTPSWGTVSSLIQRNPDVAAFECGGTFPVKTNAGVAATGEPWMLLCGDDVLFHPGWWEAAMAVAGDGIGVIGTNDLHLRATREGRYATQILVARWYAEIGTIDEPGKVFHEGYHHDPVDMECCYTAQARRAYAHAVDSHIEHLHPAWGLRELDDTDRKGQRAQKHADLELFERRRALWEKPAAA